MKKRKGGRALSMAIMSNKGMMIHRFFLLTTIVFFILSCFFLFINMSAAIVYIIVSVLSYILLKIVDEYIHSSDQSQQEQ